MITALFNGQIPDAALAQSRGLHYGDGVFRTLLLHAGKAMDLERQIKKLDADATALGLQAPPPDLLLNELAILTRDISAAAIKLMLLRKSEGRGYAATTGDCDRLLLAYPPSRYPPEHWTQGISVFRSEFRLAPQAALAGIKHLNRLEQVLASRHWPGTAQEAILCDHAGQLIGGTRSNLFWVRDRTLTTPDLSQCGVAGMMRDKLMALAESLDIQVQIRSAQWNELETAEEIFVCNSLIGIWPVAALQVRRLPAPGALTRQLMNALNHPRLLA